MTERLRALVRGGGEVTLRGASKVVFVLVLLVLTGLAVSASAPLVVAALAMFLAYLMVRTMLPAGTIQSWIESLWAGEPLVRAWDRLWGWLP